MSRSNSRVKALPYPAIEDGNFSFPDAVYEVVPRPSGNSATKVALRHELKGAAFVEELIRNGEAQFACLLSVPKTGFRKLCMANSNEQEISWDLDIAGETPILGPVIVYVGKRISRKLTEKDGVAGIWQNQEIDVPRGARLARGRYLRPANTMQQLLRVQCNMGMEKGGFTVKANSNDGFYFSLEAALDIFQFLQNPQGELALRKSILVHAVSQCLNILKSDYDASREDDETGQWEQYRNLKSLSDLLAEKNMGHWSDEDFDPVRVATGLYPIEIPRSGKEKQ